MRATRLLLPLLAAALAARAQDEPRPPRVDEVLIPEKAFDEVLKRFPKGAILTREELRKLVDAAAERPAPPPPEAPAPVAGTLERLQVTGEVGDDGVAKVEVVASLRLLHAEGRVQLPLARQGVTSLTLDGQPARVLEAGGQLLALVSGAGEHTLRWSQLVKVQPGEERGSGVLSLALPRAASGRLDLSVPGELELNRVTGGVGWVDARKLVPQTGARSTHLAVAFGDLDAPLSLAYRPKRAVSPVTPYSTGDVFTLFEVKNDVVTLSTTLAIGVYRAPREVVHVDLPPGFVLRGLRTISQGLGELTPVQDDRRVKIELNAPRQGDLFLQLVAERPLRAGEQLTLTPVSLPDTDRVAGMLAVARGDDTRIRFQQETGLERADLAVLPRQVEGILRAYRHGEAAGGLTLDVRPLEPRVELSMRVAFQLEARSVRAVAAFKYRVREGRVFALTADLPPGFVVEDAAVSLVGSARPPEHQLDRTYSQDAAGEQTHLQVKLPQGLEAGQELVLVFQAQREEEQELAGRALQIPRLSGSPAAELGGYLGFAPDAAYRLQGEGLAQLVGVPAAELPKLGLQVPGLVLGYRIEGGEYGGALQLTRRETRLSADLHVEHRVRERVVSTDVRADLDVQGAPLETLDVLVPEGLGQAARFEHPDLHEDRERVQGDVPAGWERYRLRFVRRQQGEVSLVARLQSKLPASAEGQGAVEVAALPSLRIAEAFRQRGQIAIFSADATELEAVGQGVRELEVAEVETEAGEGYPLFAYAFVGEEHTVGLKVTRHEAAPMLTAVAESLVLQTTSGADGRSRHTATFRVKNLGNQFFALRLPEGAELWSVVVDGEGVKPAERDGLKIVPITVAGEKGPQDAVEVSATYTVARPAWGSLDDLSLVAPELCLNSEDLVPVLKTEWQLTLPDDYQVLQVSGNVRQDLGGRGETPLLVSTLRRLSRGGEWLLGLVLVGLLIAASASARRLLVVALLGAEDARRGASRSAGAVLTSKVTWIVFAALAGLGFLAWLSVSVLGGRSMQRPLAGATAYEMDGAAAGADYAWAEEEEGASQAPQPSAKGYFYDGEQDAARDYRGDDGNSYPTTTETATAAPPPGSRAPMAPPPPPAPDPSPARPRPNRQARPEQKKSEARDRSRESLEKAKELAPPEAPMELDMDEAESSLGDDMAPMDAPEPEPLMEREEEADGWGDAEGGESTGATEDAFGLDGPAGGAAGAYGGRRPRGRAESRRQLGQAQGAGGKADAKAPAVVLEEEAQLSGELAELAREYAQNMTNKDLGGGGGDNGLLTTTDKLSLDVSRVDALVEQNQDDATLRLLRSKLRQSQGDLDGALQDAERAIQLRGGADAYKAQAEVLRGMGRVEEAELANERGEQLLRASTSRGRGTLGKVGLSSLVLGWTPVGRRYGFSRDGGGAELALELGRSETLITTFGILALLGCALGLALPLVTRTHVLAVLVLGVALLSALPLLILPAKLVPLCNALALGLVAAAPIHLAWALARAWDTAPLSRLGKALRAERRRRRGLSPSAAAVLLLCGLGGLSSASADEPAAAERGFRVYVPYDSDADSRDGDRVYVPQDVYAELFRRAFPDQVPVKTAQPPRNALITDAAYQGQIDAQGKLELTCTLRVDVLAEGWQTVSLGLLGTGLQGHGVRDGLDGARVRSAPAGGYELIARGPAAYTVELRLIAPSAGGRFAFSTAPCATGRLELSSAVAERRIVVGGASAQRDLAPGGERIEASVGGAGQLSVALVSREVLSTGGASEASASTRSIVYVQRGRVTLRSLTEFAVSGAGREGFTFQLPEGFEVTTVQSPLLRTWSVEQGVLRVDLRRPSSTRHQVLIQGELELDAATFAAPHVIPQGVTREQGELGLVVEEGLRVVPQDTQGLRRAGPGALEQLAQGLGNPRQPLEVASAYSFVRRPASLTLERVEEQLEVRVRDRLSVVVDASEVRMTADLDYEVRRGKAYELNVLVPAGFQLVGRQTRLDLREVGISEVEGGRVYRLGLGSGLKGDGEVRLEFVRPHELEDGQAVLGFCDVRPLGVASETADVALAVADGLRLRVEGTPAGLSARDVRAVTRGWPTPEGASWVVGYRRGESAAGGLASASLRVRRPEPKVSGSWVLHALVERDVVRYDLRALYEIDDAGAKRFVLEIPQSVGARYQIDGQNLREVRRSAGEGGRQRLEVTLQSAVESFYTLSCSWEETVRPGQPFALADVALSAVDRAARGFVLVEKGAEVPERLDEVAHEGAISPERAANAPALPPGRGPRDFAFSYRVETERQAPWKASWTLTSTGQQRQPSPARVLWSRLVSVYDGEGLVRHRVTYRVRNLRLQFLTLELPTVETEQGTRRADVWSVFVDGRPKRLHHRGEQLLIPLPKRTDADLSFDVEVTYATPLPKRFRVGQEIRPQPPLLKTERVPVERTFWTLYLPEQFTYGNFAGTVQRVEGQAIEVKTLTGQLEEARELQKIASKGEGQSQELALSNLSIAQESVRQRLQQLKSTSQRLEGESARALAEAEQGYRGVEQSRDQLERERLADEQAQKQDAQQGQYESTSYGWKRNAEVLKRDEAKWSGVNDGKKQRDQQNEASGDEDLILNVQGESLNLKNAEVVTQTRKGGRLEAQTVKDADAPAPDSNVGFGRQLPEFQRLNTRSGPSNQPSSGEAFSDDGDRPFTPRESVSEAGLLSLAVSFDTPGRALYFEGGDEASMDLAFTVYPAEGSSWFGHLAQALALIALVAGAWRLGLLTRTAHPALQALALLAVGALAALTFLHLAGAAAALVLGLAALRFAPAAAA